MESFIFPWQGGLSYKYSLQLFLTFQVDSPMSKSIFNKPVNMKSLFTPIFLFIITYSSSGQTIIIENEPRTPLIFGVNNSCIFLVEGIPCKSILLKTDNGIIETKECSLQINPEKKGLLKIDIYKKANRKEIFIGSRYLRVDDFPLPTAYIGNLKADTIKKNSLLQMGGIIAKLENSSFEASFEVKQYTITLIKKDLISISLVNEGARYTPAMIEFLQQLETGDKLLIAGIEVISPSGSLMRLHALEKIIVSK
jgi:GldM C-terminal domain